MSGLCLAEEAQKALVTGTLTHPHSHTLWLMRLMKREEAGERGDDGSTQWLSKLSSEALDRVPKVVYMKWRFLFIDFVFLVGEWRGGE